MAAKNDTPEKTTPALAAASADAAPTAIDALPALGSTANVKVAPGMKLVNNDTGTFFEDGVATPITVTITTLRRLADGDLTLV